MKKLMTILLALAMVFSLVACGGGSKESSGSASEKPAEAKVLRLGHTYAENTHVHQATLKFQEELAKLSGGTLTVDVYPNSILGTDTEMTEQVRMNTLDMHVSASFYFQGDYPEACIEELPFLFKNSASWYAAMDGDLGKAIEENILEKAGVHTLAWWGGGFRHFTNNVKPIVEPSDIVGLKFRSASSAMRLAMFENLEAPAISMAFSELFTALQQGTVDGQENPLSTMQGAKFEEVQKYLSLSGHIYQGYPIIINSTVWSGLTEEQQGWVQSAMDAATAYERDASDKAEEDLISYFEEKMEVNDINYDAFVEAVKPVYDLYASEYGPREWIDIAQSYNK